MDIKLFVQKKRSSSGFEYFILGADTDVESDIIVTMKEDVILKITDMRKSELIALDVNEKRYLN